jgi:signal transduction histidine kinase
VLLGEKGDLDYLALARSSPWGTNDIELIRLFSSGVEGLLLGVKLEKERIHRQALEVANLFTHQSAHEVRNYLTSLNFFLELLKEEELSPEVKEFSQRLIQHGNKVHRLINDMLSLTRPVREERIELFNLCDLLKGSVRVWGETHPGAKIDLFLPEGGSWDVKGDRMRIEEAVYNLLQNAFEASLPGSSIRLSLHLSPDENAVITIEDEGPGIPPEVFPRLFTPFFTTKAQGSGLGLTIVKRIIEGHGGTVFLANRPQGKGAVATIILPLALR